MTIIVYMFEYQHPLIFHIKVCLGTMTREGTNLTCLDCILLWHLWNILCNTLCCVECWHQAIFLIILIRSSILIRYVRYIRSHHTYKGFPGGSEVKKCLPAMRETWVRSLGWEDPLEKEMATHSSNLAGKTPWTEKPGGLQSTRSQRVGHDWVTSLTHLTHKILVKKFYWNKYL